MLVVLYSLVSRLRLRLITSPAPPLALTPLVVHHGLRSVSPLFADIKGRNILLSKEGDCKLADFGVSKQLQTHVRIDDAPAHRILLAVSFRSSRMLLVACCAFLRLASCSASAVWLTLLVL